MPGSHATPEPSGAAPYSGAEPEARRRLRLRLEAEGHPGLLPLLEEATGAVLDERFRIDGLLAVGRQSFLFAGTDLSSDTAVVIKQPAFDYCRPVLYGQAQVVRARQSLQAEYQVLLECPGGRMPRPVAVLKHASPLPAAGESPLLALDEIFLVEERIVGPTLTQVALRQWPALPPPAREAEARRIAAEFVAFWESLHEAGWHYGDISAENLLLETDGGRLWVVDGGSAVPVGECVVLPGYTPAFTTPHLFQSLSRGAPVAGDLSVVLPPLAKLLHFALTRREPFNGALPDLAVPELADYSPLCRDALAALLELDERPDLLGHAREKLRFWATA
jgi:serine/threonine protein kinase